MEFSQAIQLVDQERMYRFVRGMQGVKHPYLCPEKLEVCADKIKAEMEDIGLKVSEHWFSPEKCERKFRNIVGTIGDVCHKPTTVLMGHYDTVPNCPGANDDAIGVTALLEIARVLVRLDNPPPVCFVAVALEECSNPAIFGLEYETALRLGIRDRHGTFTKWQYRVDFEKVNNHAENVFGPTAYADGYRQGLEKYKGELLPEIVEYFNTIIPMFEGLDAWHTLGTFNRMGSFAWIRDALASGQKIRLGISLDEMGTYRYAPQTQRKLGPINFFSLMIGKNRLKESKRDKIGDFVLITGNAKATRYAFGVLRGAKRKDVNLKAGIAILPFSFDMFCKFLPVGLNSDHAGFFQKKLPGLFVFDTANARNCFNHNPGDTVRAIDFDRVEEIVKSVSYMIYKMGGR